MGVRAGYKQTEVGVIPEDWGTAPLGNLTVLMTNGFVGTARIHYVSNENGVLYIQGYNVKENAFNFHGIKFVTEDFHRAHMKSCLRGGDLLTVQTGEVGLTTVVPESLAGSNCHALIISRFDQKQVCPTFIAYYLNSDPGRFRLRLIETGTTMKHLNVGDMLQFFVPLPPTNAEQEAIAEALSDADALIESLEQLLVKKRQVKQGAMQELLTGKRRLPGFEIKPGYKQTEVGVIPEDWNDQALGDSCDLITKGTTPTSLGKTFVKTGIKFLKAETLSGSGGIVPDKLAYVDSATHALLGRSQLVEGDLLISIAGVLGRVGMVTEADVPANTNQALAIVRLGEQSKVERLYLFHSLRGSVVRKQIRDINVQAAQANISLQDVRVFRIPLPPTKAEQESIATILSDMDAEISALEGKLAKTRQLKQGMMHELLTGKIRLIMDN
jgi:type I restriction enzyme S subunit